MPVPKILFYIAPNLGVEVSSESEPSLREHSTHSNENQFINEKMVS